MADGRRLAVIVAAAAAVVAGAVSASAHAVVVSTTPPAGFVVATAPGEVTLRFDEPVVLTPAAIRVYDDHLHRVDMGGAGHRTGRRDTVGVRLRPGLGTGTYTVTYRLISADSHPVAGGYTFSVGAPSAVTGSASDLGRGSTVVGVALGTARFVSYAGLVVGLGGLAFFVLWPAGRRDRRARRLVAAGFGALLAGSIAALFLEAPYVVGEGLGRIADGRILSTVVTSHLGVALIERIVVVALILALFRLLLDRGPYGFPLTIAGVAVVLADTFADAGHSSVNDNYGLALLSDGAHVLAMTAWLGGLVMILAVVRRSDPDALDVVLPRFSTVAVGCLAVIVGTGSYQAIRNVGYWPALVDTTYGRLVLAKIAGVILIVVLGYVARRRVIRREYADLSRGLAVEVVTGVAVLGVTAVLAVTVPGKTAYPAAVSRTIVTSSLRLHVEIDPAKVGPATIRIDAFTAGGRRLDVQDVTGWLRMPAQGVGPLPVPFGVTGAGRARAALTLAAPGTWQLVMDVQATAIGATAVATTFTVT